MSRAAQSAEQLRVDALHALISLKVKEDAFAPIESDDDSDTLDTEEKIQARAQARNDLEVEWKQQAGLSSPSRVQGGSVSKSVRFENNVKQVLGPFVQPGPGPGPPSMNGTSISSRSSNEDDSFVTQMQEPPKPLEPQRALSSRLLDPFRNMVKEIQEEGFKEFASSIKV